MFNHLPVIIAKSIQRNCKDQSPSVVNEQTQFNNVEALAEES